MTKKKTFHLEKNYNLSLKATLMRYSHTYRYVYACTNCLRVKIFVHLIFRHLSNEQNFLPVKISRYAVGSMVQYFLESKHVQRC